MRAGCRSRGAVAASVAAGRATRAVAKASAGSPRPHVLVAPDQVALRGDRHVGELHRPPLTDGCQQRHVRAEQLPEPCSDDRVGFRYRDPGAHQAGRGAVGGLEHRVDLGLYGGRVLMDVDAEGQETAGGRAGHRHVGRAGHREQQSA